MSARFPDVDWYCDECDADLGEQPGFDDNNEVWDCAECGHDNPISEDVIFDPWEFLANFDPNRFGEVLMFTKLIERLITPLALLGLGVAVLVAARGLGIHIPDPFSHERVDNSQPPLLKSIQKLSEYHAAQGNFEVVVDLEDDVAHVPDWLSGRRAVFVGTGTVDAYVDFSALREGAVALSADKTTVEVVVPAPQLDAGDLDLDSGHLVMDDRGWLDRLADYWLGDDDPDFQLEVMQSAEQKISDAAQQTELKERAEENTQAMLEGFLRALGYRTVTITFDPTAPDATSTEG